MNSSLPTTVVNVRQYKNRKSPADSPTANYDVEMDSVASSDQIRSAYGDDRNWGLPTWVSARWEHGDLVVERFESDF